MKFLLKIKNLFSLVAGIFRQKPVVFPPIPDDLRGPHDCGLQALYVTQPHIPVQKIKDAFMCCAENWPYGGVTKKDFNVSLIELNIRDTFEFVLETDFYLSDFLEYKKDTFIVLIPGHYTVVSKGVLLEKYLISDAHNAKTHCYWRLLKSASQYAE